MTKVMYIHGAFSAFKPKSEKVIGLKKEFDVVGTSYSMEKTFDENLDELKDFCIKENVDVVIGTSLGGFYASWVAARLGLPSVGINPSIDPAGTIDRLIGSHTNYATGEIEHFTKELAKSFPLNNYINTYTLVCVGLKDDVIEPEKTIEYATSVGATVIIDDNEDHYWEFFEKNKEIKDFISNKPKIILGSACHNGVKETVERLIGKNK